MGQDGGVTTVGAVFLPQVPPERLRPVAEAADRAGLAQLWLWEDCFWTSGVAAASAALAWTERLQVGVGAAGRDFLLGLAHPGPEQGQKIISGVKATAADCYAGLTNTIDPVAHCIQNISGLSQIIEGLTLAFHGCVYIGAYIATGGAIQLSLTLAPLGAGRAAGTARIAEDLPLPGIDTGAADAVNGVRLA
jgi:hypothetical protein